MSTRSARARRLRTSTCTDSIRGVGQELGTARPERLGARRRRAARRSDVDQWGRTEHIRALARRVYDPIYRTGSASSGKGCEHLPANGGALLVPTTPARSRPTRPSIMHGIETRARPAGLRPGRQPVPHAPGRRHAVVAHRRRRRPPRQRLPAAARGAAARARVPRGHQGHGQARTRERYQLRRFGRGGFVEIAMRAGVPIVPIAVVGAEESMPILFKSTALAKAARRPLLPDHRQHARVRPARARWRYFPAKFKIRVLTRCTSTCRRTRSATRAAGSWTSPSTSARRSRTRSTTCCARAAASGSAEASGACASSSPGSARSGAAAWRRRSRPTRRRGDRRPRHATTHASRSSAPSTSAPTRATRSSPASCRPPQVDTIVHTFLSSTRPRVSGRTMHEINVIGTMNLFAAARRAGEPGAQGGVKSRRSSTAPTPRTRSCSART